MEEVNPNSFSIEQAHYLPPPNIPGVQKDIEFVTEHSNDPIALSLSPHMVQEGKSNALSSERVQDHSTCNVLDVQKDTNFIMEHLNDPNFDLSNLPSSILGVGKELTKIHVGEDDNEAIFDNDSPYLEVRAAVSSVDDPLMPVNTFRMWFLGILFVLLTSGLNQILVLRYPSMYITVVVVQLLSLPLGQGLAAILPTKYFKTSGYIWSLNPGPFSIKEHVCITVMASISLSAPYSSDIILARHVFYGQMDPMSFQILLALGSQCLSICFGGILRQFVVWPSSMIWPGTLVNCTLFNTLHHKRNMAHERFFYIAMAGSFIWYWVPGYLFTALSMFNWICWIAPNDIAINVLFGTNTGLGMSILTFNWGVITYSNYNPLATPWWCQLNIAGAFLLVGWFIAPVLYFTNVWNVAHFPIFSFALFDNTGSHYNAQKIVTSGMFDPVKYAAYSPVYIPIMRALSYGSCFATFTATLVHIFLWFRKDIARRFHNTLEDEHDIHSRLMQYYPEVPMWWYGTVGIIAFVFLCIAIKMVPTQLPIWAAVIGVLLSFTFIIPLSILQAISNLSTPVQVMYELIGGYIIPGQPIANMIFKAIGNTTVTQAINFAADLKLGHYMKIPPQIMFTIQLIATIIACIWSTFVQQWMLDNVKDICTPGQKQGFICPGSTIFATASVLFGAVGPQRLFSPGSPYSMLLWFFPIGFFAPIPFYLLACRFPHSIWRYTNVPAFFLGVPITPGIGYSSWILCGFIFNRVIRRHCVRWWMRYNYLLSVALDAGTAISMIVMFLTLTLPKKGGIELNWWGNTVWKNTADANGTPFKPLPESGFIGPAKWS